MSSRGQAEARAVSGGVLLLAALAAVGSVFPGVEHALNVAACWLGGGVLAIYLWLIVRDLLP